MEFCWTLFSGCFEGSTAWNLAYFVDFFFNETVFVSSLDDMTCECDIIRGGLGLVTDKTKKNRRQSKKPPSLSTARFKINK